MVEHAFCRARLFPDWTALVLATCDIEIAQFGESKSWPVVMTADTHTRALDRVAEAAAKVGILLDANDIVVNVQSDEPMLQPDMIGASIRPLLDDPTADCTLLGMAIAEEEVYRNPDALKVVHDLKGNILYTSRSPIPYCKVFSPAVGARRIYGIFAFRWHFLQTFAHLPESPLEIAESCDSNRIFDNGYRQKVAPFPYRPSYSVDSPSDTALVEAHLRNDPLWGTY
jgi:3-deoxy-manno-octulosonate cytidylyltransferase (CMP-KDO synthetase)